MPRHVRRSEPHRKGGPGSWPAPRPADCCNARRICNTHWNGMSPEEKLAHLQKRGLAGPQRGGGPDAA